MAGEIERWITVNGNHIPIMKGESAARAVGRFIKGKRMTRNVIDRKKREDDFKETLQREKLKSPTNYLDRTELLMEDKYGKDWDKTIRNKQKYRYYKGLFNRPG